MRIKRIRNGECDAAPTCVVEGYRPGDDTADRSLNYIAYACDEHYLAARTEWLPEGLNPFPRLTPPPPDAVCGDTALFEDDQEARNDVIRQQTR